jgi:hypothetical protein
MIIDDRPFEWLSEEEKKERIAERERIWNSYTKEEQEMIERIVKETSNKPQN